MRKEKLESPFKIFGYCAHSFIKWYGQSTGIENDSQLYGRTRVKSMVEPMMI